MSLTTCYMCWKYDMDSASGACSRCLGVVCDHCKQALSEHTRAERTCPAPTTFSATIPWSTKPKDIDAYWADVERRGREAK